MVNPMSDTVMVEMVLALAMAMTATATTATTALAATTTVMTAATMVAIPIDDNDAAEVLPQADDGYPCRCYQKVCIVP